MPDDHRQPRTVSAPQFDVVALGASAGGVEALHVVETLPVDFPVYFAQPDAHLIVRDEVGPAIVSLVAPAQGEV